MDDQPDNTNASERQRDANADKRNPSVSNLREMKRHQARSVLNMQEEQDDASLLGGTADQAQSIAIDLEVDHSGTSVYLRGQSAVGTEYPPIIVVHDFASQLSHYRSFCQKLVAKGFSTYSFDLRGHGRSGKVLGHIPNFNVLVSDLLQVAGWVKHRENGRAPVIVTHGLSALVAAQFQQKHRKFCAGVVLAAPTIKLVHKASAFQGFWVSLAADIYPQLKLPRRLVPKFSTPVKVQGKSGLTQNINPMRMSAKFTQEIYQALDVGPSKLMKLKVPSLILLAGKDTIVDVATIKDVLQRHKQPDLITVENVPESNHNMITEHEATVELTLSLMERWIKEKIISA